MCYAHLTLAQRYQIEPLMQAGCPVACIARKLRVHRCTIYRELNRGAHWREGYVAGHAQDKAARRGRRSAANHPAKPAALWRLIRRLIGLDWSPEQVRGYLNRFDHPVVSVPAIYAHLHRQRRGGGRLYEHLRYGRRRHRWGRHSPGSLPPTRPSIHSRPAHVQERRLPGHWEGDTLMGNPHSPHRLLALVERVSRCLRLRRPKAATRSRPRSPRPRPMPCDPCPCVPSPSTTGRSSPAIP